MTIFKSGIIVKPLDKQYIFDPYHDITPLELAEITALFLNLSKRRISGDVLLEKLAELPFNVIRHFPELRDDIAEWKTQQ